MGYPSEYWLPLELHCIWVFLPQETVSHQTFVMMSFNIWWHLSVCSIFCFSLCLFCASLERRVPLFTVVALMVQMVSHVHVALFLWNHRALVLSGAQIWLLDYLIVRVLLENRIAFTLAIFGKKHHVPLRSWYNVRLWHHLFLIKDL